MKLKGWESLSNRTTTKLSRLRLVNLFPLFVDPLHNGGQIQLKMICSDRWSTTSHPLLDLPLSFTVESTFGQKPKDREAPFFHSAFMYQ